MRFGITLANRGVLLGLTTVKQLLALADAVETSPLLDALWVGDALFVNPRSMPSLCLLPWPAAPSPCFSAPPAWDRSHCAIHVCSPTNGPRSTCCRMAAPGLSVCSGGGGGAWDAETAAMDIPPAERRRRMIENVHVLRHLWARDNEPFEGRFIRFSGITLEPKPVQAPCPIWLTTNAARLSSGQSGTGGSALALERVGRVADGWMTHSVSPAEFRRSWAVILAAVTDAGRAIAGFDNVLCHHVNINEDRDAALADGKQFLDLYYAANYSRERLEAWLAYGSPRDVVAQLQRYAGSGCSRVTVRLATMGDAMAQLRRLTEEVLPCEPVHTSSGIRQ